MVRRKHDRRAAWGWALVLLLAAAAPSLAGGFYVMLQQPAATSDPRLKDAVLIVHPGGCIQAGTTAVSVTAEGLVNGERRSIAVPVSRVSPDVYAVKQHWPAEGAWVLVIRGSAQHAGGGRFQLCRLLAWQPRGWSDASAPDLPAPVVEDKKVAAELNRMLHAVAAGQIADTQARSSAR
jgi:hypothetical protein